MRKEKTATIFFDIEKAYDKVNKEKTLERLETWEYGDGSFFADDLVIYITQNVGRVASRAMQGVINKLYAWAAKKRLTFFPHKTVSMTFRKRRRRNEEQIEIMLRNKIIPSKESIQFLGMILDSKLN